LPQNLYIIKTTNTITAKSQTDFNAVFIDGFPKGGII